MGRDNRSTKDLVDTELFKLIDTLVLDQEIDINDRTHLSFEQNLTFANQMRDIYDVAIDGDRIIIKSNVLNILGIYGPIPDIYNELFLDEARDKNTSIKEFLDIFHHKLLSLAYAIYKQNTPSAIKDMIINFAPISLSNLSLIHYFFQKNKTSLGLTALVQDILKIEVKTYSFKGDWIQLEEENCNKLFQSYTRLGENYLLGNRYYDFNVYSVIEFHPISFQNFFTIWKNKLEKAKEMCWAYLPFMTGLKFIFNIHTFKAKKTPLKEGLFLSINSFLLSREKNIHNLKITL